MILVDELTRERVEEVVAELLRTGDYDKVFRIADDDELDAGRSAPNTVRTGQAWSQAATP